MTLFDQPAKESSQGDQTTVHGGHRLSTFTTKMVLEIDDVPGRHSIQGERFGIGGSEPLGKLLHVAGQSPAAVVGEVVSSEKLREQNIIGRIKHGLSPVIGHELDTSEIQLV